jgi:magnesium transporter
MSLYKKISPKIELITIKASGTASKLNWYNIVNAGKPEIDFLRKKFNFDFQHLKASAAKSFSQRPMLMAETDYLFMILHFPNFLKNNIIASEIEFFIGHDYIITIHNNNLPALNDFFNLTKKDPELPFDHKLDSVAMLLSEILDRLVQATYPILDHNSRSIDEVEDIIFRDEQKQAVSTILILRRNIINVRKIMQNHKEILRKLKKLESALVHKKRVAENYARLVEHSKRIWDNLENQREMIEVLNNTNESLLNHKLNNIMKTLTIFSVIVIPLTLLAGVFGMNAKYMPFVDHVMGFWIIISLMAVCGLFMLLFFHKKKWLK